LRGSALRERFNPHADLYTSENQRKSILPALIIFVISVLFTLYR
jgi:hypothetical protein